MTAPRTAGRLGRQPNQGKPRIRLTADHVPAAYSPPATLDRYSNVPSNSWGMDGNDSVGDCTCADVDHEVKSAQVAAGNSEATSNSTEVLAAYSAITGYNPADPSTDQGAEMQGVRSYWQKTGFRLGGATHQVMLFAEVDVHNEALLKWVLDQFGAVGLGIAFPDSAMTQFNAGQPWDVVPGEPEPVDGHAVAFVGYDADFLYVVTWGVVWRMTWAFYRKYVDEAWTVLMRDFVNAHTGLDPLAGTLYDLGQQFAAVTTQPNPVQPPAPPIPTPTPAPTPVPVPPTPTPSPTPVQGPAALALAAALRKGGWIDHHHIGETHLVAKTGKAWLAETGQ